MLSCPTGFVAVGNSCVRKLIFVLLLFSVTDFVVLIQPVTRLALLVLSHQSIVLLVHRLVNSL